MEMQHGSRPTTGAIGGLRKGCPDGPKRRYRYRVPADRSAPLRRLGLTPGGHLSGKVTSSVIAMGDWVKSSQVKSSSNFNGGRARRLWGARRRERSGGRGVAQLAWLDSLSRGL